MLSNTTYFFLDRLVSNLPVELRVVYERLLYASLTTRMYRLFSQFIRPGDLVFDIGANVGKLTAVFLALGARVVAVEPQPACVTVLNRRFGTQPQVTIIPGGVAEKAGTLPFYISSKTDVISTFSTHFIRHSRYSKRVWDTVIEVPVTTLDELIEIHGIPAFIKIDTEGFELNVLKGLTHAIPHLSFEFTRELKPEYRACIARLSTLGHYRYNYSRWQHYRLVSKSPISNSQLLRTITADKTLFLCGDIYCDLENGW
ncbi:MAG: FkbM family methyltransferase [Anaerolineaceae bacterium]